MKTYYKEDYTDYQWWEVLTSIGEELPKNFNNLFDDEGEVKQEYYEIWYVDEYEV